MIAVFPGTFDPYTKGHHDLLLRSSKLFTKIIIAVSASPRKSPLFDLETRTLLIKKCVKNIKNVEVIPFSGMLVDFLKKYNANVLIRGIRNNADADYELSLQGMYKALVPSIEIVMLPSPPNLSFISSTFVRDIIAHNGDVSPFIEKEVLEEINKIIKI